MKIEELKKVLEENGYHIVYIRRFKTHDRIKVEREATGFTFNLKGKLENIPIEAITECLFIKEKEKRIK
jgi:hypothetical protein